MTLEEMRKLQREIAGAMAHLEHGRTRHAWCELERAWIAILVAIEREQAGASHG